MGLTGKTIKIDAVRSVGLGGSTTVYYSWLDPVTGKREAGKISWKKLRSIRIRSQAGRFKVNRSSGTYWPPYYVYNPIDGVILSWTDQAPKPLGTQRSVSRACPRYYRPQRPADGVCSSCKIPTLRARTNLSDRGLDFFLKRSGIDPTSREAAVAKRLSKAWLNPFSSEDEIETALQDVVKAATGK